MAMEAGITKSYYCNGTSDVNDACLTAMEAGICMIITATHKVMKITLVSQQSKLDELIFFFFHTYDSMKITRVSLQSKLDELLLFLHTNSSMKITRVSLQLKSDGLISMLTRILRRK